MIVDPSLYATALQGGAMPLPRPSPRRQTVAPISFVGNPPPGTGAPMPLAPADSPQADGPSSSRTAALAALLKGDSPVDYSSVGSPLEGLAKMGQSAIQGWETGQVTRGAEADKAAQAKLLSEALLGDNTDTSNPYQQKVAAYLAGGGDPAVALKLLERGKPPENWTDETLNGISGQRGPNNEFKPFPASATAKPPERPSKEDEYGVIRYIDTGEPVFTQPAPPTNGGFNVNGVTGLLNTGVGGGGDSDPVAGRQPLFKGTTLQAQALNQLYMSGAISKEEATRRAISDEMFRPLTDPKERAFYGIPGDDKGAYQIDSDGKITSVGGASVKVENNLGPTGIQYGNPETGFAWKRDAAGNVATDENGAPIQVRVQGGSEDTKYKAAKSKVEGALGSFTNQQQIVEQDIGRALKIIHDTPSTGFYSLGSALPGSPQFKLKELLGTIKANIGFDKLQDMRQNSPTGGALGSVSDMENQLLQAVEGSLSQQLDDKTLTYNLNRIMYLRAQLVAAKRAAYQTDYGASPPDVTEMPNFSDGSTADPAVDDPAMDELVKKYGGQ